MQALTPVSAATAADPYPYYASLVAERPFYHDANLGMWVASSAQAVETVLRCDALHVRPPAEPVPSAIAGTPAGDLFGRFMRMTDGAYHDARKQEAVESLARLTSGDLRTWAHECAGTFPYRDVPSFMHRFPAYAMAHAAGFPLDEALRAADAALEYARSFSSGAANVLLSLHGGRGDDARVANAIGLLFQSVDATAGLIGNTLCALGSVPSLPLDELVAHVARYDSPVQNTRRYASGDVTILGNTLRTGEGILVIIGAANHDPRAGQSYTFGIGPHACPAEQIARALAIAAVCAIQSHVDLADLQFTGYRPALNVRIPEFTVRAKQASAARSR